MKRLGLVFLMVVLLMLGMTSTVFAAARELTHKSIEELEILGTSPAIDDYFLIMDTSAGEVKKSLPAVAVTGDVSFDSITMNADTNITMGTGTIQFDSVKDDFVFTNDIDIEDVHPHLNFRDIDDNVAYMWHLDSSSITGLWSNFTLWRGTDDGTGFIGEGADPLMQFDADDNCIFPSGRVQFAQGADVASANNLVLGTDGNTFEITGTTQINLISNLGWQNGSIIYLLFTSNPTVKDGQATASTNITILLSGSGDFTTSSDDTLTLMLCEIGGTQAWREIARTVI